MNSLNENLTTSAERNIVYKVEGEDDGTGYLISNVDSEYGIVLIQEWWGLNKSITITAQKFADKGFKVLCPDMYKGKVAQNTDEAGHSFRGLDWASALKNIKGAGDLLRQKGCKKIGITGFCMGGALTIAVLATYPGSFDAGVPFYGVPDLSKFDLSKINVPVLAHFGENDHAKGFSDPETAKHLQQKAKEGGVNFTLHLWENADHAFMNQDRDTYNPDLAKAALDETVMFFDKCFKA